MKLWEKGIDTNKFIEEFTVGKDKELDMLIAKHDVLGSIAHIMMLESINLLKKDELKLLKKELIIIYERILDNDFFIEDGIEDIHSQIELELTRKLGDIGKKIHSGRSRNDQVITAMKLYNREQITKTTLLVKDLFDLLIELSNLHKTVLLPGYTHLQIAMPSSFGLWFGAYAESLTDDIELLLSAYKINNQNPLGSGAGYGSSFPLNRTLTTELLGFNDLNYNVVYAQMTRGKTEKIISYALSSIAHTLSKLSADACLYMSQNFNFISFPDELTTGSSIMPHKKNPDVFELIRSKCNKLQSLPNEISLISNNLTSGYFRDMQMIKESFFPAFDILEQCINATSLMFNNVRINKNILDDSKYLYLFSVESVNKEVLEGVPFRDAYMNVASSINDNSFKPIKTVTHTHEGSIGNLCNDNITAKMNNLIQSFNFKPDYASETLLSL